MSFEESHPVDRSASYKVCIATGLLLLGFFYYFTFWTTSETNYANDGTGIISILVCLSPAASGAITLLSKHLASNEQAIVTAVLVIHLLSMFGIVIHVVKEIPVPKNALVSISRIWAFTSIGLAILAIIVVIFPDLINRKRNSR